MDPIFKKLNIKTQPELIILNAPDSFRTHMEAMSDITKIREKLTGVKSADFALAFVTRQIEIDEIAPKLAQLLTGDAILWFAYPKGTSKRYKCDFNRDTGWKSVGDQGFEPVRMVAIDEDWSALRFRRVEHIKVLTRGKKITFSEEGKKRIQK
ncbi:MAG: hypothetical protein MUC87_10540 [Bacteroidia bacterium]|jgi:hypothetical protein|nr:hypothetical protein [Bacteroidia bacterium]